jgi:hypothetical protein
VAKQPKADQKAVNRRLNALEKENSELRLALGMVRETSSSSSNRGGKSVAKLSMTRPTPDHACCGVHGWTLNGHGWKATGPCHGHPHKVILNDPQSRGPEFIQGHEAAHRNQR